MDMVDIAQKRLGFPTFGNSKDGFSNMGGWFFLPCNVGFSSRGFIFPML